MRRLQKSSWKAEEVALGNAAAVERKGDMRRNDNTHSKHSYTKTKAPPCRLYLKTGKCRFGEQCKFVHDPQPPPSST
eukprot:3673831-Prorocentrum_lima.AAC.1